MVLGQKCHDACHSNISGLIITMTMILAEATAETMIKVEKVHPEEQPMIT